MAKTIVLSLLVLVLLSCDRKNFSVALEDNDPLLAEASIIINNKCLSCHQDYSFSSNQEWIDSKLVIPGELNKSIIYSSLRGVSVAGAKNMPPKHLDALNKEEIKLIENWIINLKGHTNLGLKTKASFLGERESRESLLRRCITQMSQKYYKDLPFNSCEQAVDSLELKLNKEIVGDFPKAALRNFQFLHGSFFTEANFNKNNENWGTFELFDPNEVAYGLSASLFISDIKFKDLFMGDRLIGPLRKSEASSDVLVFRQNDIKFLPKSRYEWLNGDDPDQPEQWAPAPEKARRGALLGFQKMNGKRSLIFKVFKNNEERESVVGKFPIHKGFGGGILGSTSYSILNYSNNFLQVMDSENKTMRSWSKAVFRDFLCRNLPVVSIYDAHSKIKKDSKLPFQRSASCMQCHMSIDPTAKALSFVSMGHNNIIANQLDLSSDKTGALQSIIPFDVRNSSLKEKYKTNQKGKMSYRNYKGELRDLEFKDIDELGRKMLLELDPYICFSKRYLEYFLNLRIDLDDLINRKNNHSPEDRYIYNELINLGKSLQASQSPRALLKEIFSHDLYQYGYEKLKVEYVK